MVLHNMCISANIPIEVTSEHGSDAGHEDDPPLIDASDANNPTRNSISYQVRQNRHGLELRQRLIAEFFNG